jgi:cytochrome c
VSLAQTLRAAACAPALLLCAASACAQQFTGDAARGEKVFQLCAACHDLQAVPGSRPQGPPLAGIAGRRIGAAEGFEYSRSLKDLAARENVWSRDLLEQYLAAPWRLAPKTTMSFPGLSDAQERADVIEFLAGAASP